MKIKKAVITAASPGQHTLPLQRLVDRQGVERTALELVLSEVSEAELRRFVSSFNPAMREPTSRLPENTQDACVSWNSPPLLGMEMLYDAASHS